MPDTVPGWKELIILSLVWRGSIHGYEVKRLIGMAEAVSSWTAITHSDIYHALERLEKRGWAEKGPRQGRHVTPFSITDLGQRCLSEAIEFYLSSADHAYFMEFLVAVKFMDILDKEKICKALVERRKALIKVVSWMEKRLAETESWPEQYKANPEAEETLLAFARSQVDWTEELIGRVGCSKA